MWGHQAGWRNRLARIGDRERGHGEWETTCRHRPRTCTWTVTTRPVERRREPEVRRSVDGVLSTSLRCAYTYRDIGGMHLYLRAFGPVGRSAVDVRFFHLVTVFWLIP